LSSDSNVTDADRQKWREREEKMRYKLKLKNVKRKKLLQNVQIGFGKVKLLTVIVLI
jgi:hypothetical protein